MYMYIYLLLYMLEGKYYLKLVMGKKWKIDIEIIRNEINWFISVNY